MRHQRDELCKKGIPTGCILPAEEMTAEERQAIVNGKVSVVLTSPEAVLSLHGEWRALMRRESFRRHICLLAFDEAHCICNWGEDFRPIYSHVAELRSILSSVPVLVMSATLPTNVRDSVFKTLHLDPSEVTSVCKNPDRPNIFLNRANPVKKDKESLHEIEEPQWLLDYINELRREGCKARKAIIYCRYINTTSRLWGYIMHALQDKAWSEPGSKKPAHRLVDMFHSSLDINSQARILRGFSGDGVLRCVVSTIAFGMGIDIADIRLVYHWGLSKSAYEYWQEVGRCSRDGKPGEATLFLLPARGHVQVDVDFREMMTECEKENKCIRQCILDNLWLPEMGPKPIPRSTLCAAHCGKECLCERCTCCIECKSSCPCVRTSDEDSGL
ncbi:ATP-dependent DNA helicase Q-like SIM [Patiria miniata]|uniref:DNA 3'-5' helicase n=1 Tax=Patiria miniata TaxID=46514 RepID=A0A914B869_PATMI|nr:ATP-dependent DNA helicase Q-like SIM [Patiria miniata]